VLNASANDVKEKKGIGGGKTALEKEATDLQLQARTTERGSQEIEKSLCSGRERGFLSSTQILKRKRVIMVVGV